MAIAVNPRCGGTGANCSPWLPAPGPERCLLCAASAAAGAAEQSPLGAGSAVGRLLKGWQAEREAP